MNPLIVLVALWLRKGVLVRMCARRCVCVCVCVCVCIHGYDGLIYATSCQQMSLADATVYSNTAGLAEPRPQPPVEGAESRPLWLVHGSSITHSIGVDAVLGGVHPAFP